MKFIETFHEGDRIGDVYLCKQMTDRSLTEIGYRMGRRTHATMLHSIAFVRDMMEHDAVLRQQIAQIEATIKH